MIMKGRAPLRLPVAGVLSIGLMAGATLPAWATGGQQSAPPPPPSPPVITAVVPAPSSPPRAKTPAPRAQNPRAASPATAPTPAPPQAPATPPTVAPSRPGTPVPEFRPQSVPPPARPATKPAPEGQPSPALAPPKVVAVSPQKYEVMYYFPAMKNLPAEGQSLLKSYEADVDAIYREVDPKIEARRQAAIKALEALQDQYTKAGKLDEAVAIRDYLRAGGPSKSAAFAWKPVPKGR